MKYTTNYGLRKLELTDSPPDITELNSNWDSLDTELKSTDNKAGSAYAKANTAHNQANSAYSQANSAYSKGNSAHITANSAYTQANNAYTLANGIVNGGVTANTLRATNINVANADISGLFNINYKTSGNFPHLCIGANVDTLDVANTNIMPGLTMLNLPNGCFELFGTITVSSNINYYLNMPVYMNSINGMFFGVSALNMNYGHFGNINGGVGVSQVAIQSSNNSAGSRYTNIMFRLQTWGSNVCYYMNASMLIKGKGVYR